eukprot:3520196-Amphidinium_carterae.2
MSPPPSTPELQFHSVDERLAKLESPSFGRGTKCVRLDYSPSVVKLVAGVVFTHCQRDHVVVGEHDKPTRPLACPPAVNEQLFCPCVVPHYLTFGIEKAQRLLSIDGAVRGEERFWWKVSEQGRM